MPFSAGDRRKERLIERRACAQESGTVCNEVLAWSCARDAFHTNARIHNSQAKAEENTQFVSDGKRTNKSGAQQNA